MKDYIILKKHAEKMFLIRTGNYWFVEEEIGDDRRILYRACSYLIYFSYVFMTFMEIMAVFFGNFPENEKSEAITFSICHLVVIFKIYLISSKKSLIKSLNKEMIVVCQNYEQDELMAEKYRALKINLIAYLVTVYGTCVFFVFDSLKNMFAGEHFVMVVTYYPVYEDDSPPAIFVRVLTTTILIALMTTMIVSVDTITVIFIIIYKYKFITIKDFFERLRKEVERLCDAGENDLATERLATGVIEGIKMHSSVLKLSTEIDKAFGTVLAIQLYLSMIPAVSILLNMSMTDDLSLMAAAKLIFFIISIFFLLGLFLCNAGEITYQASLVSDAIFYCGWDLVPALPNKERKHNIRQAVALTILQAQRPLIMKAFKLIELNYETFLKVVRATYSLFALLCTQQK